MTFPNHVAGGITFTGVFAAICGVNIFSSVAVFMIGVLASILPDIDIPSSPIGRMFYPLSKWLHRKYGHRTLTHSFIAMFSLTLIVGIIESWFHDENLFWVVFLLGYLSHLVLDMITIQGVQLFYPFSKSACVLPGKKEYRFQTGNKVHEISVFAGSVVIFMFCQPLMKQGFWTTYNRSFATPKHVYSEFIKSEDLLEIDYEYRIGSQEFKGTGYCIESNETGMTLIHEGRFKKLNSKDMVIKSVVPTHTGKEYEFNYFSFVGISLDSLNSLVSRDYILELEVQGNQNFVTRVGEEKREAKKYKEKYINHLLSFDTISTFAISNSELTIYANPRLATLENKLKEEELEFRTKKEEKRKLEIRKVNLENEASLESDLYRRESLMKELETVEKKLETRFDDSRIRETRRKITEVRKSDAIKRNEKLDDLRVESLKNRYEETRFTGAVRFVFVF